MCEAWRTRPTVTNSKLPVSLLSSVSCPTPRHDPPTRPTPPIDGNLARSCGGGWPPSGRRGDGTAAIHSETAAESSSWHTTGKEDGETLRRYKTEKSRVQIKDVSIEESDPSKMRTKPRWLTLFRTQFNPLNFAGLRK